MLFKNDDELNEFAALSKESYLEVKSQIITVEEKHLSPILGREQYAELNNAFTADTMNAKLTALLLYCRKVVGPWLCVYVAPKMDIQVSAAGARRTETTNLKTAYQYQLKNYIASNKLEAFDAQEVLLKFLENNSTDYPLWTNGEGNKEYKKLFIKTATEFNELFSTAAPHSNFWAIKSKMVDVEELLIKKTLGSDLFISIKEKANGSTATEPEKNLIFAIKKAVAAFAIAEALPFINLKIDDEGLSSAGGNTTDLTSRTAASDNAINLYKNSAADTGRNWLTIVKQLKIEIVPAEVPEQNKCKPKSLFGLG